MGEKAPETTRDLLGGLVGVWQGTFLSMTPEGGLIDRRDGRRELRIEAGRWFERLVLYRDDEEPEVRDLQARFDADGGLSIDDERAEGQFHRVRDDTCLVLCRDPDAPDTWISELITLRPPDLAVRIRQHMEGDELASLTVIHERRLDGALPAEWW